MEADGGDGGLAVVVLTAPGRDEVPWSGENEARWSGERTKGRLKLTSCSHRGSGVLWSTPRAVGR